ncbi:MAG: hypothetical protein AAFO80_12540 [Pseudomonadota bacterium]
MTGDPAADSRWLDQFRELFSDASDEALNAAFLAALAETEERIGAREAQRMLRGLANRFDGRVSVN